MTGRSGVVPSPPAMPPSANGTKRDPSARASVGSSVLGKPVAVRQVAAPRRWSAKGVAAAVICVLLGGLVLMYAVPAYSHRQTVVVVARTVDVGSRITGADLTTARITTDPALSPIPASQLPGVVGEVATVGLRPGTLLTRSDVGTSDGFTAGQVLVPLSLTAGQFPARGLTAGDHVLLIATLPPNGSTNGTTAGSTSGSAGSAPAGPDGLQAIVAEVGATDPSTGQTVIDIRVPEGQGAAVARLGASGGVTLLLLPVGS